MDLKVLLHLGRVLDDHSLVTRRTLLNGLIMSPLVQAIPILDDDGDGSGDIENLPWHLTTLLILEDGTLDLSFHDGTSGKVIFTQEDSVTSFYSREAYNEIRRCCGVMIV